MRPVPFRTLSTDCLTLAVVAGDAQPTAWHPVSLLLAPTACAYEEVARHLAISRSCYPGQLVFRVMPRALSAQWTANASLSALPVFRHFFSSRGPETNAAIPAQAHIQFWAVNEFHPALRARIWFYNQTRAGSQQSQSFMDRYLTRNLTQSRSDRDFPQTIIVKELLDSVKRVKA